MVVARYGHKGFNVAVTRQTFKKLANRFVNQTFADFNHTFFIESLIEAPDGLGGYTSTWFTFATVTGFVQKMNGSENQKDDQLKSDYPTMFMFEYIEGVTNKMRIVHKGNYYNIRSIVPVQDVDVWLKIEADEADAT